MTYKTRLVFRSDRKHVLLWGLRLPRIMDVKKKIHMWNEVEPFWVRPRSLGVRSPDSHFAMWVVAPPERASSSCLHITSIICFRKSHSTTKIRKKFSKHRAMIDKRTGSCGIGLEGIGMLLIWVNFENH